ncbi:ESX secretion-associated protein EspG [Saccharomonospora xinjiangensis]
MMAVLTRPVALPRALLLHLWELEGLGDPHPLLGASDLYLPQDQRGEFTRRCFRELGRLGLAREDMLTREFRVALRIVASPGRELYCWSTYSDAEERDRKFLVASAGGDAVAMQVKDESVTIVPIAERHLVEAFLGELPEFPPAPVPELHTTRQAFDVRAENHDMFAAELTPEMEFERRLKAPREAVHQVYAGGTPDGRYRRSEPLSVIDLREEGRILVFADGQQNLHSLPGTPANLAKTFAATWQNL